MVTLKQNHSKVTKTSGYIANVSSISKQNEVQHRRNRVPCCAGAAGERQHDDRLAERAGAGRGRAGGAGPAAGRRAQRAHARTALRHRPRHAPAHRALRGNSPTHTLHTYTHNSLMCWNWGSALQLLITGRLITSPGVQFSTYDLVNTF